MKTIDPPKGCLDAVISEVRQAKKEIFEEHGGTLDSFFSGIRTRQATNPMLVKAIRVQKDRADQPTAGEPTVESR